VLKKTAAFATLLLSIAGITVIAFVQGTSVVLTIFYDNESLLANAKAECGFSCLIEGYEHTALSDAGSDPTILFDSMALVGVEPARVDVVAAPHVRADHIGGLPTLLDLEHPYAVSLPRSFPSSLKQEWSHRSVGVVEVADPVEICAGVVSTWELLDPTSANPGRESFVREIVGRSHIGRPDRPHRLCSPGNCQDHGRGSCDVPRRADRSRARRLPALGSQEEIEDIVRELTQLGAGRIAPTHGSLGSDVFRSLCSERFARGGVGAAFSSPRQRLDVQ
jgi:hypothetical protein